MAELHGELPVAEAGYENALWLLGALTDEAMYEGAGVKEEDKISVEKGKQSVPHFLRRGMLTPMIVMTPIKTRLDALRRKMAESKA